MEDTPNQTTSPAGATKPDTIMADNPPKYVPQFSAATEMILKRINSGASASSLVALSNSGPTVAYTGGSAKYEDMRRSVLMGMKTSMNMELPSTPNSNKSRGQRGGASAKQKSTTPGSAASGTAAGKGKGKGRGKGKGGIKRKRGQDEDEESEEESEDDMSQLGDDSDEDDGGSFTALPKITQSGRQINKPATFIPASYETPPKKRIAQSKRSQEQALCKRCGRGHSPEKNMIVFCDGCNLCWHQSCHDPPISEDTVKDEVAPWFCVDCARKRGPQTPGEQTRGISWQGRSADDKRNYFNSLPHNQLVSLLMQTTVLHPNIPIFPATANSSKLGPSRTNSGSQQSFSQSAASTAGLFQRSEANPRASMNFIRKIPPGSTPPLTSANSTPAPAQLPTQNLNQNPPQHESRESTPASPPYPKPGNGLMAMLGPDEEDSEWLVDADGDFEAFSHTVYDDHGNATQTGGVVSENGLLTGETLINGANGVQGHGHGL